MFGGDKVWQITSSKVVGEKKFGECLEKRCMGYYEMDWRVKSLDGLSLANALLFAKFAKLSHYTVITLTNIM